MEPFITLSGVSKNFPNEKKPAVENISTVIFPGKITGLVGPDGAGKTTLLRLMTGLLLPSAGEIMVLGQNTQSPNVSLFSQLGYMPQKFGLYEDLTVLENLQFYAQLHTLPPEATPAIFKKMLDFTNLSEFTQRLVGKLSGGMKQKLGLACALLSSPPVILLDEPSVGVDPISRRELWAIIKNLTLQGTAIVWATAYLDETEKCDEVLLLNEGKLLFSGPPQQLTQRVAHRVFDIQVSPMQKRQQLKYFRNRADVIDGVIQGEKLRVVFKPEAQPPENFHTVAPRFEDAFMDLLHTKIGGNSALAEHMPSKVQDNLPVIEAIHLCKSFGEFEAVKNIQFTIHRGEIFGLLGPNGAGKSTTFKMMCGLIQPTSGQALVSGFDLKNAPHLARARIGYMAQKFSLYSDLSVLQNLQFFSGIYGLTGQHRQQKIQQMLAIFELESYKNNNVSILSLGFKQRLALACATMHEPDILFLDEPTSGVDPLTRREFWNHINGMVEKGITIMVTTHFMEEAEYCDRIALIYRGQNIASGSPDALKQQVTSAALPDPSLEDAFIILVEQWDKQA